MGPGPLARVCRPVFAPQQHQRHALAAQLDVHAGVVGLDHAAERRTVAHQLAFERRLVQLDCGGPVQAGSAGQAEVLGHGPLGDRQAARNGCVRQVALVLESEYVLDHAYVHALLRHRLRPSKGREPMSSGWFIRNVSTERRSGQDPFRRPEPACRSRHWSVTEMSGHVPEIVGHDAENTGHVRRNTHQAWCAFAVVVTVQPASFTLATISVICTHILQMRCSSNA